MSPCCGQMCGVCRSGVALEYLGELLRWSWCTFGRLRGNWHTKRKDREGEPRILEMSSQPWQSDKVIKRTFAVSCRITAQKCLKKTQVSAGEGEINTNVFVSLVRYCDCTGNGQEGDEEAQG